MILPEEINLSNPYRVDKSRIHQLNLLIQAIDEYTQNQHLIERNNCIIKYFTITSFVFMTLHYLIQHLVDDDTYKEIESLLTAPDTTDLFMLFAAYCLRTLVNLNKTLEGFVLTALFLFTVVTIMDRLVIKNEAFADDDHIALKKLSAEKVHEALMSPDHAKFDELEKYAKQTANTLVRRNFDIRNETNYYRPIEYTVGVFSIYNTFGPLSAAAATVGMTGIEASEVYEEFKRCISPN